MSLSTPVALLGLLSLPVIIALHMLRSRSELLRVSSLSLWEFLSPQVRGASARRLPITPLLILDLSIATLLSLALAGPHLDIDRLVSERVHRILLIDISTSMGAVDEAPTRLQNALSDAENLIAASAGGDIYTVITFGEAAGTAADSRHEDYPLELAALENLVPGEQGADLESALSLARAAADPEIPAEVHVFTDAAFQAPGLIEYPLPLVWHLFGNSTNNQAIIAFSAVRMSDSKIQVFARFANFGSAQAVRSAGLLASGQAVSEVEVTLGAESSLTYSWELIGAYPHLSLEMTGSDAQPLDDVAYTAVPAHPGGEAGPLSVAVVADVPGPLLRALEAYPDAEIQVIAPEEYLPGSPFDLVAFRNYLPERWPGGTVLVVDPPAESILLGVNASEEITGNLFPRVDPLLEGVDWTGVRWDRAWVPDDPPFELNPLLTAGSMELLLHGRVGLTELIILLAETADENGTPSGLARHPAFPVLAANILRLASGTSFPQQIQVGSPLLLPAADRYPQVEISGPGSMQASFDGQRPSAWRALRIPGIAALTVEDLDGTVDLFFIGVNAGDLNESDIAPGSWNTEIASPPRPVSLNNQPLSLTPWLLAATAFLMLLEAWWAWR